MANGARGDAHEPTLTLGEFVRRQAPHLRVVSMSQPEPSFASHNVVAVAGDIDTARTAVLELESLENDDSRLGLVVLSGSHAATPEHQLDTGRQADPEHVTGMVASRAIVGGVVGAVVGALVIGGLAALFSDVSTALLAAVGGAILGAVAGGVFVAFAGMGGSDAYRQSFVAPELTDVCIVSLHTDSAEEAARGRQRLAERPLLAIVEVESDGTTRASR